MSLSAFDFGAAEQSTNMPASSMEQASAFQFSPNAGPTPDEVRLKQDATAIFGDTEKNFQQLQKADTAPANMRVDYAAPELVDPFAAQSNFESANFDPKNYSANMQRFAAQESWGDALWKGLKGFGHTAWQSFSTGPESTLRTVGAIATLGAVDTDAMNDAEKLQAYYEDQEFFARNQVFDPTKAKVAGFMQNIGFSAGTMAYVTAEFLATELLTGWITGGTSGAVSLAKNIPMLAKLGKGVARGIEAGAEATELARQAKLASETAEALATNRAGLFARTSTADILEPVVRSAADPGKLKSLWTKALDATEKYVPLVGDVTKTGREISQAARMGATRQDLLKLGYNGFKRGVREFSAASNEASLETVQTYGDVYTELAKQHRDSTGEEPDEASMRRILDTASKASSANFNSNLGIILLSNKLQFGNLFNRYVPANKFLSNVIDNGGEKAFGVMGRIEGKATSRVYRKGALGEMSTFGKIKGDFGTAFALKRAGISLGKGLGKMEVTEGLQENLQETSQTAWKGYFEDKYNNIPTAFSSHVQEGLGQQFSKQGLETFLTGALTGTVMRPFHWATGKIMDKANDLSGRTSAKDRQEAADDLTKGIDTLNAFFKNPNLGFRENIRRYREQYDGSASMADAANAADPYVFSNERQDALFSAVRAARSTGTDKLLSSTIRSMSESFNEADFKEAFGVDVKDTKHHTVQEFLGKVASDVDRYGQTMDDLHRRFRPHIDASAFSGEERQTAFNYQRFALDRAVETVAYYQLKGEDATRRILDIADRTSRRPVLGSSADYMYRVMAQPANLHAELGLLNAEIKALEQAQPDADIRKQINQKKKQVTQLQQWSGFFDEKGNFVGKEYHRQEMPSDLQDALPDANVWKPLAQPDRVGMTKTTMNGTDEVTTLNGAIRPAPSRMDRRHPAVRKLFAQMLHNNQAQATTNPTAPAHTELDDALQDVLDYMSLDQDAKAYLQAFSTLANPAYFGKLHQAIGSGAVKAQIGTVLSAYEDLLGFALQLATPQERKDKINELRSREETVKLQAIYLSKAYIHTQADYVHQLIQSLGKWLQDEIRTASGTPQAAPAAPAQPGMTPPAAPAAPAAPAQVPATTATAAPSTQPAAQPAQPAQAGPVTSFDPGHMGSAEQDEALTPEEEAEALAELAAQGITVPESQGGPAEPFQVVPIGASSAIVVDDQQRIVTTEVPAAEAQELAADLNEGVHQVLTLVQFGEGLDMDQQLKFSSMLNIKMKKHNKDFGTRFKTLPEFLMTEAGQKAAQAMRQFAQGADVNEADADPAKTTVEAPPAQEHHFDAAATQQAAGVDPELLQDIHNSLVEVEIVDLQNGGKSDNFGIDSITEDLASVFRCL